MTDQWQQPNTTSTTEQWQPAQPQMYAPPGYPMPVAPAPRRRPPWLWIGIVSALAVALAAVTTILLTNSSGGSPSSPGGPATFTVSGQLLLANHPYSDTLLYTQCSGGDTPGYDDITPGAQVVVYDNAGTAIATGALGSGDVYRAPSGGNVCRLRFTVAGVPVGRGPYFIEVTHRGRIAFNQADAEDVELSLG